MGSSRTTLIAAAAALAVASASAALPQQQPARPRPSGLAAAPTAPPPPPPPGACHGGPCGGMAHYPTAPGIEYYAEFTVPGKPKKAEDSEHPGRPHKT